LSGHRLTEETKKKISITLQGRRFSPEHRMKISLSGLGKHRIGHPQTEETRLKISLSKRGIPKSAETKEKLRLANLGKHPSEETRKLLSLSHRGRIVSQETRDKLSAAFKGRPLSDECKRKISIALLGKNNGLVGCLHPCWKGGITPENVKLRTSPQYKEWRKAVWKRDSYICLICGQPGKKLNAHHKVSWKDSRELRYDVSNGMTLCTDCHREITLGRG